jgi:hypothetical protein
MNRRISKTIRVVVICSICFVFFSQLSSLNTDGRLYAADDEKKDVEKIGEAKEFQLELPATVAEARGRARLLYESLHGTLQVVHRDFFDEEESLTTPSKSLEDVFEELARTQKVTLKWVAVDTTAMNIDHKARGEYQKKVVDVLSSGKNEYEEVKDNTYLFAGSIRLSSRCLKCHVPRRSNNKNRTAALLISMPMKKPSN